MTIAVRALLVIAYVCASAFAEGAQQTTSSNELERSNYPAHWWALVPKELAASWEILPQEAGPGEVILSKRNELGILSNFAATTFTLDGVTYPGMEGFWQMMLYPEGPDDPRRKDKRLSWKYTRDQVSRMIGFEANAAGALALQNAKQLGIDWVTYRGEQMPYYHAAGKGKHYDLIVRAMWEKVRQNPDVRTILLKTGKLILRPDHHQPADAPPSWRYFQIYMEIREQLQSTNAVQDKP